MFEPLMDLSDADGISSFLFQVLQDLNTLLVEHPESSALYRVLAKRWWKATLSTDWHPDEFGNTFQTTCQDLGLAWKATCLIQNDEVLVWEGFSSGCGCHVCDGKLKPSPTPNPVLLLQAELELSYPGIKTEYDPSDLGGESFLSIQGQSDTFAISHSVKNGWRICVMPTYGDLGTSCTRENLLVHFNSWYWDQQDLES